MRGLTLSRIDWATHGWPVTTGCKNKCSVDGGIFCYAYNMVTRGRLKGHPNYNPDFSPKFNKEYLEAPSLRRKPANIFIAPLGELWGPWVPYDWQTQIILAVKKAEQHNFLSLTKNPEGILAFQHAHIFVENRGIPQNLWLGVSVSTPDDIWRIYRLMETRHPYKFVSFEPLLGDVAADPYFSLSGIRWIIVGGLSKGSRKIDPDPGHFMRLLSAARSGAIPVFVKDNCKILANPPREMPDELRRVLP